MKVIITGCKGQLGTALQQTLTDHTLIPVARPDYDITFMSTMDTLFKTEQPDVVINAAAYTNVDGCVKNPMLAYRVNAQGPKNLALLCRTYGTALVQVSTNEVFDGLDQNGYEEWRRLNPQNPYGRSKAAGEFNVRSVLSRHYIIRTAWMYAEGGHNFIHAILRRAKKYGEIKVVTDEIGNPTWAQDVAIAIAQLIQTESYGTYHFVNAGTCSRWTFANEILKAADLEHIRNVPILSREFRRASTPPPFGALHNINGKLIDIELQPWQEALHTFVKGL